MARRTFFVVAIATVAGTLAATPAFACGGLVGENGTIQLVRTTTLAAYHDGVERYVTSFEFTGEGKEVGSIVPLPGVPSNVERGGDWTLQRLTREVAPPRPLALEAASARGAADAEVLLETKIDALDITVLRGGGDAVGRWALDHGFLLTPDAPEVLDFYARRSPVFMAARFDASRARDLGQRSGDGTPIMVTIPTDEPWVPLRILGLGLGADRRIDADVFLLTDDRPELLTGGPGLVLARSETASKALLDDLRSDKGMAWVPERMHLTYLQLGAKAGALDYDLAVSTHAGVAPSRADAGLTAAPASERASSWWWLPTGAGVGLLAITAAAVIRRRAADAAVSRWRAAAVVTVAVLSVGVGLVGLAGTGEAQPAHPAADPTVATATRVLGPGAVNVLLRVEHSRFVPNLVRVRPGTDVRFVVVNDDPINHELIVGPRLIHDLHESGTHASHPAVPGEVSVPAGDVGITTYRFDEPDRVLFACHLPGHFAYGMVGEVRVERR